MTAGGRDHYAAAGFVEPETMFLPGDDGVNTFEVRRRAQLRVEGVEMPESYPAERQRVPLQVNQRNTSELTNLALLAVAVADQPQTLFERPLGLVRLRYTDDGPVLAELSRDGLSSALDAAVQCFRLSAKGVESRCFPPAELVRHMYAARENPFPRLRRLVTAPVFVRDVRGRPRLLDAPGYDATTGIYYAPGDLVVPPVPEEPDLDDFDSARWWLAELLGGFPFDTEADRAHALALLFVPFVRELVDRVPNHLLDKPTSRTGASLLANVCALPYLGHALSAFGVTAGDEAEIRKAITAHTLTGGEYVFIDNLHGTLDSASIARALTSGRWQDRHLGTNEMVDQPLDSVWVTTSNQATLSTELVKRSVRVYLDAQMEHPDVGRSFLHPDLEDWTRRSRAGLVWSALVLVRAWVSRGCPVERRVSLAGFERWSQVLGGILHVAGVPGFLRNVATFAEAADTETEWQTGLVEAWWEKFDEQTVGAAQLSVIAVNVGVPLGTGGAQSQSVAFGVRVRGLLGKIIAGYRVERGDPPKSHGAAQYRLRRMSP